MLTDSLGLYVNSNNNKNRKVESLPLLPHHLGFTFKPSIIIFSFCSMTMVPIRSHFYVSVFLIGCLSNTFYLSQASTTSFYLSSFLLFCLFYLPLHSLPLPPRPSLDHQESSQSQAVQTLAYLLLPTSPPSGSVFFRPSLPLGSLLSREPPVTFSTTLTTTPAPILTPRAPNPNPGACPGLSETGSPERNATFVKNYVASLTIDKQEKLQPN